jgi:hypothetical protein
MNYAVPILSAVSLALILFLIHVWRRYVRLHNAATDVITTITTDIDDLRLHAVALDRLRRVL